MIRIVSAIALFATPLALAAQAPAISVEQRMMLRCSAGFALVVSAQERGNADALQYPDLSSRGESFFVRAAARVMEETGLTREHLTAAMTAEARDIHDNGSLPQVMQVCLPFLPPETPPETRPEMSAE